MSVHTCSKRLIPVLIKSIGSQGNTASITKNTDGTISVTDADGNAVTGVTTNTDANGNITGVTGNFFSDGSGNAVTVSFTSDTNYIPGDDEIVINSQVGEVLLGENVYKDVYTSNSFSVQYDKSGVEKVLGENQITLESGCVKCGNFTLESGYEK